ncbi:MAG: hypothetical protein EOP36_15505 [Rubrivivax sp.]|nr:MAG: hypothetical protein EOP36_15505 [Rubrivivax sp.]
MSYRAALASLFMIAAVHGTAQAAPVADYSVKFNSQFDASAHPELGLVNADVTAGGLQTHGFYNDQGVASQITLNASGILASAGDYTIDLDFGGVASTRWTVKLLDFYGQSQNSGLYIDNHNISFYDNEGNPTRGSSALIQDDAAFSVTLSRSSATSTVTGYINGVQQFSFLDALGLATFNPLQFFIFTDDVVTPGSGGDAYESRAGLIKGISVYQTALSAGDVASLHNVSMVPEPEGWALALGGLLACGVLSRRRRA